MSTIGKTIKIVGDVSGAEDLVVEGQVQGEIKLPEHRIVVAEGAAVEGDLSVASVVIGGHFNGRIVAGRDVSLASTAKAEGSIVTPVVKMDDGAGFRGSLETRAAGAKNGPE